jgi:general nucleoside transport system ATP-binding protein
LHRFFRLLGEKGSQKTTLMKVLFGIVQVDAGRIVFRGTELSGHDPKRAIAQGTDMVHPAGDRLRVLDCR